MTMYTESLTEAFKETLDPACRAACRDEDAEVGKNDDNPEREDAPVKEIGFEDEDEQLEPEGEACTGIALLIDYDHVRLQHAVSRQSVTQALQTQCVLHFHSCILFISHCGAHALIFEIKALHAMIHKSVGPLLKGEMHFFLTIKSHYFAGRLRQCSGEVAENECIHEGRAAGLSYKALNSYPRQQSLFQASLGNL